MSFLKIGALFFIFSFPVILILILLGTFLLNPHVRFDKKFRMNFFLITQKLFGL